VAALILVAVAIVVGGVTLAVLRDDRQSISIGSVEVGSDDRTLTLVLNACNSDPVVRVEASANEVVLDVRGEPTQNDCADGATVRLDQPLGDRELIDGGSRRVIVPTLAE
jgi:hypothetical protein